MLPGWGVLLHQICPDSRLRQGTVYSDDEEEEVSEYEEVDEEIEAGTPPDTAVGTAVETAAEVATKIHVAPSAPSTSDPAS